MDEEMMTCMKLEPDGSDRLINTDGLDPLSDPLAEALLTPLGCGQEEENCDFRIGSVLNELSTGTKVMPQLVGNQEVKVMKTEHQMVEIVKTKAQEFVFVKTEPQEFECEKTEFEAFEVVKTEPEDINIIETRLPDWSCADTVAGSNSVVMETEQGCSAYAAASELRDESPVSHVVETEDHPVFLESGKEEVECRIIKEEEEEEPNRISVGMNPGETFSCDLVEMMCLKQHFLDSESLKCNEIHQHISPSSIQDENNQQGRTDKFGKKQCVCVQSEHTVCQKFGQSNKMKRHIETVHLKKKRFECPHCQQTFGIKRDMKKHIDSVHLKKKEFECLHCKQRFSANHHLKQHIETIHLKKKEFECPCCKQRFTQSGNMKQHIETVHLKKKEFECLHCKQRFNVNRDMKRHIETVHLKKKKVECPYCKQRFSENCNMKRHIQNVHLKKKEFECPHCEQRFSQNSSLKRHNENVHLKKKIV